MIENLKAAAEGFIFLLSVIQVTLWTWKTTKLVNQKLRKLLTLSKIRSNQSHRGPDRFPTCLDSIT